MPTVTFNNTLRRGDLKVTKTSEDGLVEGMKFHLYGTSYCGLPVDEYSVTDASGIAVFDDVLIGTGYTLEEVGTPDRYIVPDDQTAAIEWNKVTNKSFDNELKRGDLKVTAKDCKPISHDDAIEDKVIVIRGNVLRPEFRHASHQLMLCTGGFGAQKNARGRTCYCISLYSGKQTSFYRGDVLGVMDKRSLPEWAKIGLQNALEIRQNEKSHPNERGEAR